MLKLIKQLFSKRWLLSSCSVGITFVLLLLPSSSVDAPSVSIPHLDKIAHVCLFAACAFSLVLDFRVKSLQNKNKRLFYIFLIISTLFVALFTEIIQDKYLNRTFSYSDMVADFIGIFVGLFIGNSFIYDYYFNKFRKI